MNYLQKKYTMKKYYVFVFFFAIISQINLTAQTGNSTAGSSELLNGNHQFSELSRMSKLMSTKSKKKKLLGSPYVYEKWSRAKIDFDDGGWIEFDNIKIDILNDYVEVSLEGVEKILDKKFFSEVKIANPATGELVSFVDAGDYYYNKKRLKGFVKKRVIKDFEIIKHYTARLSTSGRSGISETSGITRVSQKNKLYISKNGKLYRIKKRKDLYKVFNKNQKKVKAFIKKNGISHKDENDLIKLVNFYQN